MSGRSTTDNDEFSDEEGEAAVREPHEDAWGTIMQPCHRPSFRNDSDEGLPECNSFYNKTSRLSDSDQSNSADDELVDRKESLKFESMTTRVDNSSSPFVEKARVAKRQLSESDSDNEPDSEQNKFLNFKRLATEVNSRPAYDSSKALAMMEKMGYKKGKGLGKHAQGQVDPVELSKQRGRRGLGMKLPGLEPAKLKWDSSMEVVQVHEDVYWLEGEDLEALSSYTLKTWIQRGTKVYSMKGFNDFCNPKILENVLNSKSVFDSLDAEEMRRARTRSNPFETIRNGLFLNRAAMKMANMDRVFDFMFTKPVDKKGMSVVHEGQLLYFADVCAGPGGFSEYVLWRKKWRTKGFGFTLKGENDFKLSDFYAGPCESFEPYYGESGDGNVFDPKNIESLTKLVMDCTDQLGVHFMMADGGFSVDGQENIQELLSKQLYLCQFLVALSIVRTGGHFVCKLFDVFTPFSVGLIYLMYRSFEKISIHKPNTSRPANSERYIICKWKRDDCDAIRKHMFDINEELWQMGTASNEDITHCVPLETLLGDQKFFKYICDSNDRLGERQIVNLTKIASFCRDPSLYEERQADIRKQCLAYWEVPDIARKAASTVAEELFERKMKKCGGKGFLTERGVELKDTSRLEESFKSIYDWLCVPVGSNSECYFFLGLGRSRVCRVLASGGRFSEVEQSNLELSAGTLVYGELVQECVGEGRSQRKLNAFHIIDAVTLGDEDVSSKHYTERRKLCELFSRALQKKSRPDLIPIRVKPVYDMEHLNDLCEGLIMQQMKNGMKRLMLPTADNCAFHPSGVVFFKATKEPWTRSRSRKTNYHYYHSPYKESKYEAQRPPDACASVKECIERRRLWLWDIGAGLQNEEPKPGILHKDQLLEFIRSKSVQHTGR